MPWSPQRYLEEGLSRNHDHAALQEAIKQINRMQRHKPTLPSLLTLGHLACRTRISHEHLRSIVARNTSAPTYRSFRISKRSGGTRRISAPGPQLKTVQSWLAQHILNKIHPHPASHAFSPGSSIANCARQHIGARWLIKIDIADFFGSITEIQVYRIFQALGYNKLISFELARLCTILPEHSEKHRMKPWKAWHTRKRIEYYSERNIGRLPQGAPTSPMLANLAMLDIDTKLQKLADHHKLTYTRYSDDITFSAQHNIDRNLAANVIQETSKILKKQGLFPNQSKTTIIHPGARKIVLGLLVDGNQIRLTRDFRDRLRQHLYYLEKRGIAAHVEARGFDSAGGLYRHLRGLIDYANMVDPYYAERQLSRLSSLPWNFPL